MTVNLWSKTAASNATADPSINYREGQAASTINNSARAAMAAIAKWRDDMSGNLETGGSSTAYTLTTNQSLTPLVDGYTIVARINATNGASPTLNVDSTGAKAIRTSNGVAVATAAMLADSIQRFTYDSDDDCWYVHGFFATPTLALTALLINSATELTTIALDDEFPLYDLSTTTNKKITTLNILNALNLLTEDTTPDEAEDFLLSYDTSTNAVKKVKPNNLLPNIPVPTVQLFGSGTGTYTSPALARYIRVRMVAGGGGGGAANTNDGGAGGTTSFGSWTALGGAGGEAGIAGPSAGGTGGVDGTGTLIIRLAGANGHGGETEGGGGGGGSSVFGGSGPGGALSGGVAAKANTGSGGGGGASGGQSGGGGAAGEYVEFFVTAPVEVSYAVGAAGAAGSAGGAAGGAGAAGGIIVEEYY